MDLLIQIILGICATILGVVVITFYYFMLDFVLDELDEQAQAKEREKRSK